MSNIPTPQPYTDGDMPDSIRVACASNSGDLLNGHFGSCERFLVYQVSQAEYRLIDVRDVGGILLGRQRPEGRRVPSDDAQPRVRARQRGAQAVERGVGGAVSVLTARIIQVKMIVADGFVAGLAGVIVAHRRVARRGGNGRKALLDKAGLLFTERELLRLYFELG